MVVRSIRRSVVDMARTMLRGTGCVKVGRAARAARASRPEGVASNTQPHDDATKPPDSALRGHDSRTYTATPSAVVCGRAQRSGIATDSLNINLIVTKR
jgi:hypothetical protein